MSVSSVLGSSASVPSEEISFSKQFPRARGQCSPNARKKQKGRKQDPGPIPISTPVLLLAILLAIVLGMMGGCQGLPVNVANCPIVPTPPANLTVIPPAQEPPPKALCGFPLQVSAPASGASVTSPVPLSALASAPDPIYYLRVYVDGFAVLYSFSPTVNQFLWMADGPHQVEVVAEDVAGYIATNTFELTVTGQRPGSTASRTFPTGSRVPQLSSREAPAPRGSATPYQL